MFVLIAFNLLLVAVGLHALRFGGEPERVVALLLLLAAAATWLLPLAPREFHTVLMDLYAIDTALLAALVAIAMVADRYWPMWIAALQLMTVGVHAAKAYRPEIIPQVYWLVASNLAWPIVFLLLLGSVRERSRRAAGLPTASWWWSWSDERAQQQRGGTSS